MCKAHRPQTYAVGHVTVEAVPIPILWPVASLSSSWQLDLAPNNREFIMILPITLTAAGAAALINIWLAIRCGQVRTKEKISVGDGGSDALIRRMRAHSNFVEFTPFVLILIGLIEMANGTSTWLWVVSGVYLMARLAHAFGMDGNDKARGAGIAITMLVLVGLAGFAIAIPYLTSGTVTAVSPADVGVEEVPVG
jgi:uncharacterized protein